MNERMIEQKFQALARMKCRARGVLSQGEHTLRLHTLHQHGQQAVLNEVRQQTMLNEQRLDAAERLAEAQEEQARNTGALVWIAVLVILLSTIEKLFL